MKTLLTALLLAACAAPALAAQPASAQPADQRPDIRIAAADRALAIGNLAAALRREHFSVEEGARIARALERNGRSRRYVAITSGRQFAAALTEDLRAISGDPHFMVDYFVRPRPFPAPAGGADEAAQQDFSLVNYGVRSAERLDGNIGYLRIDRFAPAREAGPAIEAAVAMLAATEALVIDLRYNGGGHGDTTALLAGLLLPEPARMSDVIARDGTMQVWTPVGLSGRYTRPVYVLTSARTFSAAEGFAYNLRALGRVKIVGERTRGGANPVTRTLLSARFWAMLPVAQTRNPITGGNWQGTGVVPDIESPADQALAVAQRDAARQIIAHHPDDPLTRELQTLVGPASG
ncbi:MAG TPA: S41 family peptidase [Allosphingosinicella sp.]|nr:S41 family peptidase [Allosphingosinicella sp.]